MPRSGGWWIRRQYFARAGQQGFLMQRLGWKDPIGLVRGVGVWVVDGQTFAAGIWVQRKEGCVGMKREEMHL
jgi:hypothetical protein